MLLRRALQTGSPGRVDSANMWRPTQGTVPYLTRAYMTVINTKTNKSRLSWITPGSQVGRFDQIENHTQSVAAVIRSIWCPQGRKILASVASMHIVVPISWRTVSSGAVPGDLDCNRRRKIRRAPQNQGYYFKERILSSSA